MRGEPKGSPHKIYMIRLHDLKPNPKSRKRVKIVGRGLGSGHGTFSGRGIKGQKARQGGKIKAGFEGGRMPLMRQVPKMRGKGFKGSRLVVTEINLSHLAANFSDNEVVTPDTLLERGLVTDKRAIKILGTGDLSGRKLSIQNVSATASAKKAVEAAGGKVE
jgi:large subunit ribosomal protein L15